jgi:hypothetical protein
MDGPRRQVYIKFYNSDRTNAVLQATRGRAEFRHETGELSVVQVDLAGMGKGALDWPTYHQKYQTGQYVRHWLNTER